MRFVILALSLASGLAACGGGGSGSEPVSTTPSTPTVPEPARATGWLWHDNYALDSWDGMQMASLDGQAPIQLTNRRQALAPWPDGRQFVTTDWSVAGGYTDVTVVDRGTGKTLYALRVDGYLRGAQPSPADKRLIKVTLGASSTSVFSEFVLDVDGRASRLDIAPQDWFAWMSDGRFVLINPDAGTIRIGSVGSTQVTTVGRFTLPAGRRMGPIWVSPSSTQFVVRLPRDGAPSESDLWIGNVDGSGLEQLTDSNRSFEAQWSPDGRFIAYDKDGTRSCTGTVCSATCQLLYTTPDLRKVTGVTGTPGSSSFRVNDRNGLSSIPLGCHLVGWTP